MHLILHFCNTIYLIGADSCMFLHMTKQSHARLNLLLGYSYLLMYLCASQEDQASRGFRDIIIWHETSPSHIAGISSSPRRTRPTEDRKFVSGFDTAQSSASQLRRRQLLCVVQLHSLAHTRAHSLPILTKGTHKTKISNYSGGGSTILVTARGGG